MYVILWEFEPRPGKEPEFEHIYGPAGDWAELFARSPEYRGTELLRRTGGRGYVTVDRWISAAAFEDFRGRWQAEYDTLDKRCETLTQRETLIGRFEAL